MVLLFYIGCNASFYSIELAKRGAKVTAIDVEPHYLKQAKWVEKHFDLQHPINFQNKQIYDLAKDDKKYDIVLLMGLFYHLRYPILALDIIAQKTNKMLIFQKLMMPGEPEHNIRKL